MMGGVRWCVCMVTTWVVVGMVMSLPATHQGEAKTYQGKFWQITDIHWDYQYSKDGDPTKMCHKGYGPDGHLSIWGNYLCDSPWPLVKNAINAMVQIEPRPDFVLWTGDNTPHVDDPKPDYSVIFRTLSNITEELRTAFHPTVPLLPVLGNHDAFPKNYYPVAGKEFYGKYLSAGSWRLLLPPQAQEDFENGGYYSYKISSGLTILVVNTNLYYAHNSLGIGVPDPCGQFAWLESKLQIARREKYKVIITAHAPPGYFERLPDHPFLNITYNDAYVDLLNEFGEVIVAQIYGHEHTDSFKLFSGKQGEVESVAFVAPSVTPWYSPIGTAVNPSLRLYSYTNSEILDYFQYYFNLSKETALQDDATISTSNIPKWELLYQARETYRLSSLNTINMVSLLKQLESNDSLFQNYYLFNSAGFNNGLCDPVCKRNHICAIAHLKRPDLVHCLNKTLIMPNTSLHEHLIHLRKDLENSFSKSNVPQAIMILVGVSMSVTVMLTVVLAVMLILIVIKKGIIRGRKGFPSLNMSNPHLHNYRKLP